MSEGPVVFHCFLTIEILFQPKPEWKYWNEGSEIFLFAEFRSVWKN